MTKACLCCGGAFEATSSGHKYCTFKCSDVFRAKERKRLFPDLVREQGREATRRFNRRRRAAMRALEELGIQF